LTTKWKTPFWIGHRLFSQKDLDLILWTANKYPELSRTELACTICENLDWKAPTGKEHFHSCVDLLEKLAAHEMLTLSEKRKLRFILSVLNFKVSGIMPFYRKIDFGLIFHRS
jgi:hypothetical protein